MKETGDDGLAQPETIFSAGQARLCRGTGKVDRDARIVNIPCPYRSILICERLLHAISICIHLLLLSLSDQPISHCPANAIEAEQSDSGAMCNKMETHGRPRMICASVE